MFKVALFTAFTLFLHIGGALTAELPRPIVKMSTIPSDPDRLTWVSEGGRKALASLMASAKANTIARFAFAAAPHGDFWGARSAIKSTDYSGTEDLAWRALETCENLRGAPCTLVSLNGFEAGDGNGGFAIQPSLLAHSPLDLDPTRVPFISSEYQGAFRWYLSQDKPRALALTTAGNFRIEMAENAFDAVAATMAACQKNYPADSCILYAVRNRVVYDPQLSTSRLPERPASKPIVNITTRPTDPKTFDWLTEAAKKELAEALADKKAGKTFAFVFAAAPNSDNFDVRSASKQSEFVSIEDLARVALERCEYKRDQPCFLISINGFDSGIGQGPQMQPWLLRYPPDRFDPTRIPFVLTHSSGAGYMNSTKPRALALTLWGNWNWETGNTLQEAIAAAYASCKKTGAQNCFLYAANDRIVWTPYTPQ